MRSDRSVTEEADSFNSCLERHRRHFENDVRNYHVVVRKSVRTLRLHVLHHVPRLAGHDVTSALNRCHRRWFFRSGDRRQTTFGVSVDLDDAEDRRPGRGDRLRLLRCHEPITWRMHGERAL